MTTKSEEILQQITEKNLGVTLDAFEAVVREITGADQVAVRPEHTVFTGRHQYEAIISGGEGLFANAEMAWDGENLSLVNLNTHEESKYSKEVRDEKSLRAAMSNPQDWN